MITTYLKNISGYLISLYLGDDSTSTPIVRTLKPDQIINSIDDSWEDHVVEPLLRAHVLTKMAFTEANAPVITVDLPATLRITGSTTLSITATGTPLLKYQWYDSRGAINGADRYFYTTDQTGTYHVVVTNDYGSDTSTTITLS